MKKISLKDFRHLLLGIMFLEGGFSFSQNGQSDTIPPKIVSASEKVVKIFLIPQKGYEALFARCESIKPKSADSLTKTNLNGYYVSCSGFILNDSLVVTVQHGFEFLKYFNLAAPADIANTRKIRKSHTIYNYIFVEIPIKEIFVCTKTGKKYKARLLYFDEINDVAILSLGKKAHLGSLRLSAAEPEILDSLWSVGYPVFDPCGSINTPMVITPPHLFYGIKDSTTLTNNQDDIESWWVVIHEFGYEKIVQASLGKGLWKGASGGPVFNKNGEVVGIIAALDIATGKECLYEYIVPVEFITRLLVKKRNFSF